MGCHRKGRESEATFQPTARWRRRRRRDSAGCYSLFYDIKSRRRRGLFGCLFLLPIVLGCWQSLAMASLHYDAPYCRLQIDSICIPRPLCCFELSACCTYTYATSTRVTCVYIFIYPRQAYAYARAISEIIRRAKTTLWPTITSERQRLRGIGRGEADPTVILQVGRHTCHSFIHLSAWQSLTSD